MDPLDIKIVTTADTTGSKAAASSLNDVSKAAGKGTAAALAQGKAVNELGENFDKGAAAGRVFGDISRGNVLALGQLGAAIKAVGALLKTNLIGGLLTIGAIGATILLPIIQGFVQKKKAADDAANSVDAVTAAAKKLGEQRLDTLRAELDAIAGRADDALTALTAAITAANELADAQDQLDLAKIEADPSLSAEEKVTRRAAIAERAATRRSASAVAQAEGVVGIRRTARDEASRAETGAAANFTAASQPFARAREIEREIAANNAAARGGSRTVASAAARANVPLNAELSRLNDPKTKAANETALAEATKQLEAANKAALKSAEDLAAAEAEVARVRGQQKALAPIQEETRRVQTEAALVPARQADAAARADAAAEAAALFNTRAAAPGLQAGAQQVGRSGAAAKSPELFTAAKALNDAAAAAQEGGTTAEEAKALVEAAANLQAVFDKQKLESAALKASIATLAAQIKTLGKSAQ
jgi:hypothetical protein